MSGNKTLAEVLTSSERVRGLTHNFYRYPARFSGEFASHLIETLTRPGEVVLDPFMGGGTTVVEALALGRRAVGVDINPLAQFVTQAKTTPLSLADADVLRSWAESTGNSTSTSMEPPPPDQDERLRNLPADVEAVLRSAIRSIDALPYPRQRRFARCALLRIGQLALDCKRLPPDHDELRKAIPIQVAKMLSGLEQLVSAARDRGVPKNKLTQSRRLLVASTAGLSDHALRIIGQTKPRLVLTSPPYPGVHVLYHRWQVLGRRETPAPYWVADMRDGHGAAYYTMGSRGPFGLKTYFSSLYQAFARLRQILEPHAHIAQLVAFADADSQLPLFLDTLTKAGYEPVHGLTEVPVPARTVPNRRWYSYHQTTQSASTEFFLVHRVRP